MIDETDRDIISHLQLDANIPYAELGERVGLSASTINDRLKRLKAKGVIRRISAEIDPAALDLDLLVFVLVEIGGVAAEQAFCSAMRAEPAVMECHHIAGDFSYLLKVRVASTQAFESFLSEHIKPLEGIRRTQSLIALSSPKDSRALPVRTAREPADGTGR